MSNPKTPTNEPTTEGLIKDSGNWQHMFDDDEEASTLLFNIQNRLQALTQESKELVEYCDGMAVKDYVDTARAGIQDLLGRNESLLKENKELKDRLIAYEKFGYTVDDLSDYHKLDHELFQSRGTENEEMKKKLHGDGSVEWKKTMKEKIRITTSVIMDVNVEGTTHRKVDIYLSSCVNEEGDGSYKIEVLGTDGYVVERLGK